MSLFPFGYGPSRSSRSMFDTLTWEPVESLTNDGPLSFARFPFPGAGEASAFGVAAPIDWKETPEAHVFKADLPGMRKDEIKVEVEHGRVLHISGERSREHEERTDTWHRVERSSGKFIRRFRLPDNAKVEGVKAAMQDGVLTVTVPKQAVKQSKVRSIEISG